MTLTFSIFHDHLFDNERCLPGFSWLVTQEDSFLSCFLQLILIYSFVFTFSSLVWNGDGKEKEKERKSAARKPSHHGYYMATCFLCFFPPQKHPWPCEFSWGLLGKRISCTYQRNLESRERQRKKGKKTVDLLMQLCIKSAILSIKRSFLT